jgi:pimeloyl-ACP methyl ester carboxylesterase
VTTASAEPAEPGELREAAVTAADGTRVAYAVQEGAEPTVVLLHGLAGSGRELLPTARALVGRRVVLVDQRGHGRSTRRPVDLSRRAFVADVVSVVEAEAAGPVDLVGQSMGAHTAMLVAAARPDLVRRLVLLEGDQGGGTPESHRALGDFFRSWAVPFADRAAALAALGDGPLERAWVDDLEEGPDGLRPRFDADVLQATIEAVGVPRWAEWESVTAPTLVVWAEGGMFTAEQQDAFVAHGRTVTRVDLDGGSHDAHLDAHDAWIAALAPFVAP